MFKNKKLNDISNMTNPSDEKATQTLLFSMIDGYLDNKVTAEDFLYDVKLMFKVK